MKGRSSPASSVVDESRAFGAESANADGAYDDSNWDLEESVGLDDVKRVGAKRRSRDFQDSSRTKMRKIPGIVTNAFELTTESVNQTPPAHFRLSAEFFS